MRCVFLFLSCFLTVFQTLGAEIVEIDKSSDFISRVRNPDTIYDIHCVVDLNKATFSLPANVVLRFNGGSIKNGVLIGNNTLIENTTNLPIFDSVRIGDNAYQFINEAVFVDWFFGESDADKTQNAIDFAKYNRNAIHFLSRQYEFDHTVIIPMGQVVLKGTGGGGEYQDLGTKITSSHRFSSKYEGSPLFYVSGEPKNTNQTLGLVSGHITGISFFTNREHDVFQFLLSGAPSRPLFINYCRFSGCNAAIRLLDNGKSTELGFLYVEHCTMTGNKWNIVAHGRHTMLGLYFLKNVAEQCEGNINLGYSESYTRSPYEKYAPKQQDYAASANIVICDNLLEGTVDCIYINGGKCIVDIERNYFESTRRQFVVLSFSNPNSTVTFQNNYIANADDVFLELRNCKYTLQKDFSSSYFKASSATPIK